MMKLRQVLGRNQARWAMTILLLVLSMTVPLRAAAAGSAVTATAQDEPTGEHSKNQVNDVQGISVQANDEFPKVVNIVPWKTPTLSRRARPKLDSNMDELLQPVDPEVLQTQRHFRQTLHILDRGEVGN